MSFRNVILIAALVGLPPLAASAQGYGLPPGDVGGGGGGYSSGQADSAGLVVRIDRLEEQVRTLTGQLQEVQFANKRLEDLLKKFQQDVDYRFQEKGGARPQHRSDADDAMPPVAAPTPGVPPRTAAGRRSDAFDPSEDPNAPGVPRTLGSRGDASAPLGSQAASGRSYQPATAADSDGDGDPNAPLDLSGGRMRAEDEGAAPVTAGPPRTPRVIPLGPTANAAVGDVTPGGTSFAGGGPASPKEEFDLAMGYLKDKQYESAERGFSTFIQKNPKNRLASDAYYYLGESYLQRGRQAEAGQQYMKVVTDYAASPRAPEAMLRLGEALQALGSKEQACASFSQVARKYPNASVAIKSRAEREAKRFQC